MRYTKNKITSPLKFFGAKFYMARRIIDVMQYKPIMIEGFSCTSVVSLNIDERFDEHHCIDKNWQIINFWHTLKYQPYRMYRFLCNTEYSEENFERAKHHIKLHFDDGGDPFFDAVMYFICNRMSRSADMKTWGWSDRLRRGMPEYISAYKSAVESLPDIARRIQHINFCCNDYMSFMIETGLSENENVVQYLDPPYIHSSRTSNKNYGSYELPTYCREAAEGCTSHECLVSFLKTGVAGISYISGYDSPEYQKWLQGYAKHEWSVANSAAQTKSKRKMTESLWRVSALD